MASTLALMVGGSVVGHALHQRPYDYDRRAHAAGGIAYLEDLEPKLQATVAKWLGVRPFARVRQVEFSQGYERPEDASPLDDPAAWDARVLVAKVREGDQAILVGMENMTDLVEVTVWGPGVGEEIFDMLRGMRLRELSVSQSHELRGAWFDRLYVGELSSLGLEWTGVGDDVVEHLRHARSLEALYLRGTQVTGASMAALAALPRLRVLLLSGTGVDDVGLEAIARVRTLEVLDLRHTTVSDAGLAHLARHPSLQRVSLDHTAVTDAAVATLASMPALRQASVWHTGMTEVGAARLHRTLSTRR